MRKRIGFLAYQGRILKRDCAGTEGVTVLITALCYCTAISAWEMTVRSCWMHLLELLRRLSFSSP